MRDPKKSPKIAIWAPSHNFVYIFATKACIDNRKKLCEGQTDGQTDEHRVTTYTARRAVKRGHMILTREGPFKHNLASFEYHLPVLSARR